MLTTLLAAIAFQTPAPPAQDTVSDYFPLAVGTKWTYETDSDTMVWEAMKTAIMDKQDCTPIQVRVAKSVVGTNMYRIDGDMVYTVANNEKTPFPRPRPLVKIYPEKDAKWEWTGLDDGGLMRLKGTSTHKGTRMIFDHEVPIVEAKTETMMGDKGEVTFNSTAIYGKGIGLIEVTTEQKQGKKKMGTSTIKLVKFEPAQIK